MFELQPLVRKNIWKLEPYSCARDEFKGVSASAYLDANENPFNNNINRYPDPLQEKVKEMLSPIKGVPVSNIFLGNGSDEAIDLVYRIFCQPGVDNVVAIEPTYGMYKVCADINDVFYRKVVLDDDFQITAEKLLEACDKRTKVIWLCSPNNPTGNDINREEMVKLLVKFQGIVVVDEAYSEFSNQKPLRLDLSQYPNLIVLNTMSKAWAGAAIRLGMAFASTDIIGLFNKVKYPYNVNKLSQEKALELLRNQSGYRQHLVMVLEEREKLMSAFNSLPICEKIYPTAANFFLVRVTDANAIYRYLVEQGIIVRNRSRVTLCENCLRITIGTKAENSALLSALIKYKP
ncbi:MAG: histidinol-phosphate transaminase [Bacteroidaceae bacterium]|nr:histidinol-phosphate transaminase [Bacteroidaceae bacterium]